MTMSTAMIAALAGSAVMWLVLILRIWRADNLAVGQKVGWMVGLTFLFPVFSVLYFAIAPVPPAPSQPAAPVEPYKSERHTWGRMS